MKRTVVIIVAALGTLWNSLDGLEAQSASRSVWECVFTTDQAARGKALYTDKCAACHGASLGGHDVAPALASSVFLDNWSGQSLGDLAGRIHNTMPLNDPGSLRNRQVADLIAFVLSFNQFPAGSSELPAEPMLLQQITLNAEKPPTLSACPGTPPG
jgi:mono/diheme cytochrome c family protein